VDSPRVRAASDASPRGERNPSRAPRAILQFALTLVAPRARLRDACPQDRNDIYTAFENMYNVLLLHHKGAPPITT
jgi:hypothetical protein